MNDGLGEGEAEGSETKTTQRGKSQQLGLLALGHHLTPMHHQVLLLLICHTARGSPAHLSRGPAVTVLRPKITSANGRKAEGTDQ